MTLKTSPTSTASFTLVEILAAITILTILFTIMFGILQQVSAGWQAANRRVEASQAARLALEQIGKDLENCQVVIGANVLLPGGTRMTNYAYGFAHLDRSRPSSSREWYSADGTLPSDPNDSIFVVTAMPGSSTSAGMGTGDLCEVGYVPFFVPGLPTGGFGNTPSGRYVLCRSLPLTNGIPVNDFLTNSIDWELTPGVWEGGQRLPNFFPIVDHCVRFEIRFVYYDSSGSLRTNASTWGRPDTNSATGWSVSGMPNNARPGLPLAADITLSVLDERSADRLFRFQDRRILPPSTLEMIPTNLAGITPVEVRNIIQQGLTTFTRRVYFKNRTNQ